MSRTFQVAILRKRGVSSKVMTIPRFGPYVVIRPTRTMNRVIGELDLDVNEVIRVVRDAQDSWGSGENHWWIRGNTASGRTLNLLIEVVHPTLVTIKKVHEFKD